MKVTKCVFLLSICILFINDVYGLSEELIIEKNISLDSDVCWETVKIKLRGEGYIRNVNFRVPKNLDPNLETLQGLSSIGDFKYSVINGSDEYSFFKEQLNMSLSPNEDRFYGYTIEEKNGFIRIPELSLIRIPIHRFGKNDAKQNTEKIIINYTLNMDSNRGINDNKYIFLVGLPYNNSNYFKVVDSQIISESPVSINLNSYNELHAVIDIYYFPTPDLKIIQRDEINLEENKIYRTAYGINKLTDSVFYYIKKDNSIRLFNPFEIEEVEESFEIITSKGKKLLLSDEECILEANYNSCNLFPLDDFFFPFTCKEVNGEFDISNYLQTTGWSTATEIEYELDVKIPDHSKLVSAYGCITHKSFTFPPLQIFNEPLMEPMTLNLPKFDNCDEFSKSLSLIYNDIMIYYSPSFMKQVKIHYNKTSNSFDRFNINLPLPFYSENFKYHFKIKNNIFSESVFWIYLFIFSLLAYWTWYVASKKIRRNAQNKVPLIALILDLIILIGLESIGIIQLNPSNRIFTLLTLTPIFGIMVGFIFFRISECKLVKSKINLYNYVPNKLKN